MGQRAIAKTPAQTSAARNRCRIHTPSPTRAIASTARAMRRETARRWASTPREDPGRSAGQSTELPSTVNFRLVRGWDLFELVGDFVDTGFGASLVLFAARGTRDPDRPDNLVTDLYRQRSLRSDDPGKVYGSERRVILDPLRKFTRRNAEGARGIGFALAVLHRVRWSAVAADGYEDLAVAAEHMHRDLV